MNKKPLFLKQILNFIEKQSRLVKQTETINLIEAEDRKILLRRTTKKS